MALDLTAADASGAEYRLRNGVFEIKAFTSEETFVVSTEDDPNATTIDIDLAGDVYSVFLRPGWFLEQVSYGGEGGAGGEGGSTITGGSGPTGAPELERLSDLLKFRAEHPKVKVPSRTTRTTAVAAGERAELPHPVDTELVSENPVVAQVTANETTPVDFVFSLEPSAQGDGELKIGIDVVGAGSTGCEDDGFEPNNMPEQAPLVELDSPITGAVCHGDEDYYLFDPPVPNGEGFRVSVAFDHYQVDIDAALFDDTGNLVASGAQIYSPEELSTISNGGQYLLYVFPFVGEGSYTVSVGALPVSNCCAPSLLPTCSVPEVSACVCDIDAYCCEFEFDETCSQIALLQCGGNCPVGEGSCCEVSDGPGCSDQEVTNCVCAIDSRCCAGSYDELCAEQAVAECGLSCEFPAPDSDCCAPGENPSCADPEVAECTCAVDPFCCAHPFDENCVSIAAGFCGAECGGL